MLGKQCIPDGTAASEPKKKTVLLRDVCKLYRAIFKLWPRGRRKLQPSSYEGAKPENIPESTLKHKSKSKADISHSKPVPILEDSGNGVGKEGVKLCRVQSYRHDNGTDFLRSKSSLSRSWSQNNGKSKPSLSSFTRSKTSHASSFSRTNSTNLIMYSSSSSRFGKLPPTEEELECTLEELCTGCKKKIKIKRDVITNSGQVTQEEEMLEIKVKPGWINGTKVTFEGKGNEAPGNLPADLTFVVVEKEHQLFKREGDDLEMAAEISLAEALTGCTLSIPLPDGEKMSLMIDDIVYPEYVKTIEGRGMPNPKEKGKRGDLRITFQIKFPEQLTKDQREDMLSMLKDST